MCEILQIYNVSEQFKQIAIAVARPIPVSERDNKYVMVVIYYFRKLKYILFRPRTLYNRRKID